MLAPTDGAVSAMPDSAAILADPTAAPSSSRSHIVSGSLDSAAIFASTTLSTQGGDTLNDRRRGADDRRARRQPASIVSPDNAGTDGFVHVINAVLDVPPAPVGIDHRCRDDHHGRVSVGTPSTDTVSASLLRSGHRE